MFPINSFINITDMPKENCCSVLFISKKHAKNIYVFQKKIVVQFQILLYMYSTIVNTSKKVIRWSNFESNF